MTSQDGNAAKDGVTAEWLLTMCRNYTEDDEVLVEQGAEVVTMPDDPRSFVVLQRDGSHLMVQVNPVELRVG